jgi:hypothetical protein
MFAISIPFERWIRILYRGPDDEVGVEALGAGSSILFPLEDLPVAFLAFF